MSLPWFQRLVFTLLGSLLFIVGAGAADKSSDWLEPMRKVRARFSGSPGTLATFGDSITVSMAFWSPLRNDVKGMSPEMAAARGWVMDYMRPECWSQWKGPKFGNQGSMTIRWAHDNVARWLKEHNPEVAIIMFGTNDLGQLGLSEYETKTRQVVERCLENGTVPILTTIPPRGGMLDKSKQFADAVRRIAGKLCVPLIDYQAEVLARRPNDWDGSLPAFKDVPGDTYNVPTLISRDAVHPSNPASHRDFSEASLRANGYALRNYLTLLAYADVVQKVLPSEAIAKKALKKAATFHASFDESPDADFARGDRSLSTRFNHATDKDKHVFEKGYDAKVFRVARGKGIHGGALEAIDVLPRNGRIFYPGKDNLAFRKGGWGGAVSVWVNTDPDKLLKTKFCDPIQLTQKGALNGGIWFDFNDARPRSLRHGAFSALKPDEKAMSEDDPAAPMVRVPRPGFKEGKWHHVVLSWKNFDTGKKDAVSSMYIDGKLIGQIKDRAISMDWDMERAGIYVAVNYVGLLDELGVFNRELTAGEVAALMRWPGVLSER